MECSLSTQQIKRLRLILSMEIIILKVMSNSYLKRIKYIKSGLSQLYDVDHLTQKDAKISIVLSMFLWIINESDIKN